MATTTAEVPRPYGRGTSSVDSFVVPMNRVDVVDLVVDLVDLDVDLDLDVDFAVSLCDGPRSVLFSFGLVAPTCFICVWPCRRQNNLKNDVLFVFQDLANIKNRFIFIVLNLMSMLDVLVLKNDAKCTSQRLKWTSGARVMIPSLSEYFCVVFL